GMMERTFTLTGKRPLTANVWELTLAGDSSAMDRPGQFVNIAVAEHFLRRPISVCDIRDGSLTLICRAGGAGTKALCASPLGTSFSLLVGLGNGYNLSQHGTRPILIGGGVGVPPLYGLAKRLLAAGITPLVALGFASAADCFYSSELEAL
ncbi:MAG: dihydroorotate dehydrogenase electron transfer subunit, partial [Ruthenibacterium sp.]